MKFGKKNQEKKKHNKKKRSPFDHEAKGVNVFLIGIVSSILCALIVAAGFYLLLLLSQDARKFDKKRYEQLVVSDIAAALNMAFETKTDILSGIAKDNDLINALINNDNKAIEEYKLKLKNFFPDAKEIDIISADKTERDSEGENPTTWTVASMIDQANKTKSAPSVEILHPGDLQNEQMVYIQPIIDDNGVIAHLYTTFKRRTAQDVLSKIKIPEGYAEISYKPMGSPVIIAQNGDHAVKKGNPGNSSNIARTPISVTYYIGHKPGIFESIDKLSIIIVGAGSILLLIIACFVPVRVFSRLLRKDGITMTNFIEDVKENRVKLQYGLHLNELKSSMPSMMEIGHDITQKYGQAPKFMSKIKDEGINRQELIVDEITDEDLEDASNDIERETMEKDIIIDPFAGKEEEEKSESPSAKEETADTAQKDEKENLMEFSSSEGDFSIKKSGDNLKSGGKNSDEPQIPSLFDELFPEGEDGTGSLVERSNDKSLTLDDTGSNMMLGDIEPAKPEYDENVEIVDTIFRAYDIRGVVEENLTPSVVHEIGRAIGSEAADSGQAAIVVGRDGRLSGPELMQALIDGLKATGRMVIDIGVVPTPMMYYSTFLLGTGAGVALTGSHNPPNYNGLKIMLGGKTLSGAEIQTLKKRAREKNFVEGEGHSRQQNIMSDYIDRITDDVVLKRPLKIVIDCGNGVAGSVAPTLFSKMGCDIEQLFCEVDGNFPHHHPDPSDPENLDAMISLVKLQKADLGIAFDGDGDRLGVVDSKGNIIWPDRQMMLFAKDVLSRNPGCEIIYDVKCTNHLARVISENAGVPLMWKTGHSLVKSKLKETGAPLAGEMSGHIFFSERWYGFDDALYAAARLLEIIAADNRDSSEIFAELPDSVNTPEIKVHMEEGEPAKFMKTFIAKARFDDAKISTIDGLRADFIDGWGLVRSSNTTPCLVLRFDADTEGALEQIKSRFKEQILAVKSDLELSF